jgi:pSer/pThr/pTyr-binding forkhead associated (FHA) protein
MGLALKGLNSSVSKKIFPLKSGLTLGRQGEVVVPDTKASSIHARISKGEDGTWILTDNNSKNGTRVDGERISLYELTPGLIFYIGDIGFEVVEFTTEDADETEVDIKAPLAPESPPQPPVADPPPVPVPNVVFKSEPPKVEGKIVPLAATPAPPPPDATQVMRPTDPPPQPEAPPQKKRRFWNELLIDFLKKNEDRFLDRQQAPDPMYPAVVFEFVRGVQTNTRWVLGYGPRKIGAICCDLPIWEPGAPAVCFEVRLVSEGVLFQTPRSDLVHLNGQEVDSQLLHSGDRIGILGTLIEVGFIE